MAYLSNPTEQGNPTEQDQSPARDPEQPYQPAEPDVPEVTDPLIDDADIPKAQNPDGAAGKRDEKVAGDMDSAILPATSEYQDDPEGSVLEEDILENTELDEPLFEESASGNNDEAGFENIALEDTELGDSDLLIDTDLENPGVKDTKDNGLEDTGLGSDSPYGRHLDDDEDSANLSDDNVDIRTLDTDNSGGTSGRTADI